MKSGNSHKHEREAVQENCEEIATVIGGLQEQVDHIAEYLDG